MCLGKQLLLRIKQSLLRKNVQALRKEFKLMGGTFQEYRPRKDELVQRMIERIKKKKQLQDFYSQSINEVDQQAVQPQETLYEKIPFKSWNKNSHRAQINFSDQILKNYCSKFGKVVLAAAQKGQHNEQLPANYQMMKLLQGIQGQRKRNPSEGVNSPKSIMGKVLLNNDVADVEGTRGGSEEQVRYPEYQKSRGLNFWMKQQELYDFLLHKDVQSFTEIIKESMSNSKDRAYWLGTNEQISQVRTVSEAANMLRIIKQLNYSSQEDIQLWSMSRTTSPLDISQLQSFSQSFHQSPAYYTNLLGTLHPAKIMCLFDSMNRHILDLNAYNSEAVFLFPLVVCRIALSHQTLRQYLKKQSEQNFVQEEQTPNLQTLVCQVVSKWVQIKKQIKITSIFGLDQTLQGLAIIDEIIELIDEMEDSEAEGEHIESLIEGDAYHSVIDETMNAMKYEFELQDLEAEANKDQVCRIITNFQKVFNSQVSVSEIILTNCVNNVMAFSDPAPPAVRRSLICLLASCKAVQQIDGESIREIVGSLDCLSLKETLYALHILQVYSCGVDDEIIELIMRNVDPADEELQDQSLRKLLDSTLDKSIQNQRKKQKLRNYLHI